MGPHPDSAAAGNTRATCSGETRHGVPVRIDNAKLVRGRDRAWYLVIPVAAEGACVEVAVRVRGRVIRRATPVRRGRATVRLPWTTLPTRNLVVHVTVGGTTAMRVVRS